MKKRPDVYKVRAYAFQAKDLPPADEDGSSDPFLCINDIEKRNDTTVIYDNVNPIWF